MLSPDLAYDAAKDQLSYQLAAADTLSANGGVFLGVGSTVAGIAVALLALRPEEPFGTWLLSGILALSYLILTVSARYLMKPARWRDGPDVRQLSRDLLSHVTHEENETIGWRVVTTLVQDRDVNQKPYKRRVLFLAIGSACVVAETAALLGLGVIVLVLSNR